MAQLLRLLRRSLPGTECRKVSWNLSMAPRQSRPRQTRRRTFTSRTSRDPRLQVHTSQVRTVTQLFSKVGILCDLEASGTGGQPQLPWKQHQDLHLPPAAVCAHAEATAALCAKDAWRFGSGVWRSVGFRKSVLQFQCEHGKFSGRFDVYWAKRATQTSSPRDQP